MILFKKYYQDVIAAIAILAYNFHFFLYGKDTYINIHDNLDSSHVWYKIASSGVIGLFDFTSRYPNAMNGLIQSSMPNKFGLHLLLYRLMDPFWAYVCMSILASFVAYLGMKFLLKNHFSSFEDKDFSLSVVALLFALLPFWIPGGLSIAGQPLLLNALLNTKHRLAFKDVGAIIFYVLFSSFAFSGVFIFALTSAYFLFLFLKDKKIYWYPIASLSIFLITSLLMSAQLIWDVFFLKGFISHRVEFHRTAYGMVEWLKEVLELFIRGQYHAHSLHGYIFILAFIALVLSFLNSKKSGSEKSNRNKLIGFLGMMGLISIISSLPYSEFYNSALPLIKGFSLRLYVLFPLLCYIILYLSLSMFSSQLRKWILIIFIPLQLALLWSHSNFVTEKENSGISYNQFYAKELFESLKSKIPDFENKKFVTLGIHPAVAVFNDFKTLDFYSVNYDLSYKKKFREIIEPELEKNDQIKKYFDGWGSRAYILNGQLFKSCKFLCKKNSEETILSINNSKVLEMGGSYLISSVKILEPEKHQFSLIADVTAEDSPWHFYLYLIN